MADEHTVELTPTAEKVYHRAFDEAQQCIARGDATNAKVKHFRIIQEALEKVIPNDPFNPKRALSGSLSNIFRVKKGRTRICYVGSSQKKKIVVLYIADTPRKAGDRNDPYAVLGRVLRSGDLDSFFDTLGIPTPKAHTATASTQAPSIQ